MIEDNGDVLIIPDTILTEKGINSKAYLIFLRQVQKIHTHLFENPEMQFNTKINLINKFLNQNLITDDCLNLKVNEYKDKLNNLHARYMALELDMIMLKKNMLDTHLSYEGKLTDV